MSPFNCVPADALETIAGAAFSFACLSVPVFVGPACGFETPFGIPLAEEGEGWFGVEKGWAAEVDVAGVGARVVVEDVRARTVW